MQLDYSIEYDDSFSNFKGKNVLRISNGPLWVILYTDKAKKYLKENYKYYNDTFGKGIFKFENSEGKKIYNILRYNSGLSGTYGGFYLDIDR